MTWVILLIVALLLSFILSGLEGAVPSVSRVRVRHAASEGDRKAARLLPLIEDRDALLGSITVANHLANLVAFLIITWKLVRVSDPLGYLIAYAITLPVFLVLLEVLPKKLFRRRPFRSLRRLSRLLQLVGLIRPLFRTLSISPDPDAVPDQSSGRDDLRHQAVMLNQQGQLSSGASYLIRRVLSYRRLRMGILMQPLTRSTALASDLPMSAALILARQHATTLLPVLGEDGRFIGVLDLTDLPAHKLLPDRQVQHYMRSLDTVHVQDSALTTLQRMRQSGRRLCLVRDDQNEPVGLASEEDLLRHLMGTRD